MAIHENATVNVIDGLYKGRTGKVVKIHDYAESAVDEDPKFMIVGLMNALILRGVVEILFGADNG